MQDAMYETWGADTDDWETRECSDDELIGILYSVRRGSMTLTILIRSLSNPCHADTLGGLRDAAFCRMRAQQSQWLRTCYR